jgi:hypothetical protein
MPQLPGSNIQPSRLLAEKQRRQKTQQKPQKMP